MRFVSLRLSMASMVSVPVLGLVAAVVLAGAQLGCQGFACTTEAIFSRVSVQRDLTTNVAPEACTVTACAGTRCTTYGVNAEGKFGVADSLTASGGTLQRSGEGQLRLSANIPLDGGEEVVSLRVLSPAGPLLDVSGEVGWESDGCHTVADRSTL